MEISEEIMKKVEEAEDDNRNFNRCIAVGICPRCGNRLNHSITDVVKKTFTCSSSICDFTHLGYL
jgi:hypothetical protein